MVREVLRGSCVDRQQSGVPGDKKYHLGKRWWAQRGKGASGSQPYEDVKKFDRSWTSPFFPYLLHDLMSRQQTSSYAYVRTAVWTARYPKNESRASRHSRKKKEGFYGDKSFYRV